MTPVKLDFETYYDQSYSISKMSFVEYIKHPLFEVTSCSIRIGSGPTQTVLGHAQVGEALRAIDWTKSAAVAHNGNLFDFPLMVWVYDVHPKLFIDTMCMATPKNQSVRKLSLESLSAHHGLPLKQSHILANVLKGKRLSDMDLSDIAQLVSYNDGDTDNMSALFDIYKTADTGDDTDLADIAQSHAWAKKELMLMDATARAICYPQFEADRSLMSLTSYQVRQEKQAQLNNLGVTVGLDTESLKSNIMSTAGMKSLLDRLGVPAPMKISKTTGKEIPALAKTDQGMIDLLEHSDARVRLLAEVRLSEKSTLLETRLQTMSNIAHAMGGKIPVPLAYHSATTGRWGGRVWNPQNLPRVPRDKQGVPIPKHTNALRMSLRAPKGYKVVVSDLSGIELRVNHYLWDVKSSMDLYRADPQADLYRDFASFMYGVPPDQVTKDQRQLAKIAQLGLGFGAGPSTFLRIAKMMGGIDISMADSESVVRSWRDKYRDIVVGWGICNAAITAMSTGQSLVFGGPGDNLLRTEKEAVRLPSGRRLYYPMLRREKNPDNGKLEFKYGDGRGTSKIYGGLADENFVQAIARDVIAEMSLKITAATGYYAALMVHDELVYVVPEDQAEAHLNTVNSIMRTPPDWLPGIVLWSEGDIADTYGDAK